MESQTLTTLLRPMQNARTFIWFALTAAIPIYVGITYLLFGAPTLTADAFSHPLALPLGVLALLAAVVAPWASAMTLPEERIRDLLTRDPDPADLARDPRTQTVDTTRLEMIKTLSHDEQRLLALAQAAFTPFVVRIAIQESIALYGLVLALQSRRCLPIVPFAVTAVVLNLAVSPKLDSWFEQARTRNIHPAA